MKILVFSWNTASIQLCVEKDTWTWVVNTEKQAARFFEDLAKIIIAHSPELVIFGFQEDRKPGSYFHSHFLPPRMEDLHYCFCCRERLMGVGKTSYKGLKEADIFQRGLRTSVYVKKNIVPNVFPSTSYLCTSSFTRSKGAIACYISIPGSGLIAIVNCHLPFDSTVLINERIYHNPMLRQSYLHQCNFHFNKIVDDLILYHKPTPQHVLMFGDFNYRLNYLNSAAEVVQEIQKENYTSLYQQYDELLQQTNKGNIYSFSEGINGEGPNFPPTCKMMKSRTELAWNLGKFLQRVPSWCDRILFRSSSFDKVLCCTDYLNFDREETFLSDHAGVFGIYEIVATEQIGSCQEHS